MSFEAALDARIRSIPAIVARIGNRLTWGRRIVGVPAITLFVVTDPRPQHYRDFQAFRPTQVQCDAWAGSADVAREMREALIAGLVPAATIDGVRFMRAQDIRTRSSAPQEQANTIPRVQAELYRESIDFTFMHNA